MAQIFNVSPLKCEYGQGPTGTRAQATQEENYLAYLQVNKRSCRMLLSTATGGCMSRSLSNVQAINGPKRRLAITTASAQLRSLLSSLLRLHDDYDGDDD